MIELYTIEGGQKDVLLRRYNIKKSQIAKHQKKNQIHEIKTANSKSHRKL